MTDTSQPTFTDVMGSFGVSARRLVTAPAGAPLPPPTNRVRAWSSTR